MLAVVLMAYFNFYGFVTLSSYMVTKLLCCCMSIHTNIIIIIWHVYCALRHLWDVILERGEGWRMVGVREGGGESGE